MRIKITSTNIGRGLITTLETYKYSDSHIFRIGIVL
ncbi:hypothetical protein 8014-B2_00116 [Lactobacillus phage ATCC 8014-B2]|uniref:Uncharacterized protein n=1 Tax=Lactobacillus phage ATCC 8014-B2 TaxID=1225795 RepID=K4I0L6_9CAUD|nr:hypothetical protein HOQ89_gp030 [Lactobacillus phage ATCC 8014-B2]AFU63183.1 hypothetical protein 8014-B2_00116 [Lactobacillus phage ATCC 8014-B2]